MRSSAWLTRSIVTIRRRSAATGASGAACSSDKKSTTTASTSSASSSAQGASVDYKALSGTLNGSGSTFQDAFNQKAITQFKTAAPNVSVSYTKSGSGAGKTDLQNKVVQFAGTDSLIADADKPKFQGGTVLYFPTVGAPITVSYNLSGVSKLQLSGDTLGGIFSTTIANWNDPKIAA